VSCQLPAPNRLPVKPLPYFSNPFVSLSSHHSCPPPNLNWRKQMKIKWKTEGIVTSPSQFLLPSSSLYFSSFPPFFSPLCYIFFCLYSPLAQTIRSIHKEDLKKLFSLSFSLTHTTAHSTHSNLKLAGTAAWLPQCELLRRRVLSSPPSNPHQHFPFPYTKNLSRPSIFLMKLFSAVHHRWRLNQLHHLFFLYL